MLPRETNEKCELCGTALDSSVVCQMCSSVVCSDCNTGTEEICLVCHEAKCSICSEYLSARACDKCGNLVCEDHSARVDAATVCVECRVS
jgi:hypothetical protein